MQFSYCSEDDLRNLDYAWVFAVGMAWQALFIIWMVGVYTDYYVNEVYSLRDAIEVLGATSS